MRIVPISVFAVILLGSSATTLYLYLSQAPGQLPPAGGGNTGCGPQQPFVPAPVYIPRGPWADAGTSWVMTPTGWQPYNGPAIEWFEGPGYLPELNNVGYYPGRTFAVIAWPARGRCDANMVLLDANGAGPKHTP